MKRHQKQQDKDTHKVVDPKTKLSVGDRVLCKWKRDGQYHWAEIIEIKLIPSSSSSLSSSLSGNNSTKTEFYIHYLEFDKRLDEWVTDDCLNLSIRINDENDDDDDGSSSISAITTTDGDGVGDGDNGTNGNHNHNNTNNTEEHVNNGGEEHTAQYARRMKRKLHEILLQLSSQQHGNSSDHHHSHGSGYGFGNHHHHHHHHHHLGHMDDSSSSTSAHDKEHEEATKVKNVESIEIGKYEIDTWYFSPYPEEFTSPSVNPEKKLFICEFCLKYMRTRRTMDRHRTKCHMRHPPGDEIYRNGSLSMFEIDGRKQKIYCQNLCLLSKLFLDHKTLYCDVEPFMFYVMTECDEYGCHMVGYFSKEKYSVEGNNLSCILTLPSHQRKGYGKLLISFSYELSKKEEKVGSPEGPLSDLGLVSYRSYWKQELLDALYEHGGSMSIKDLSVKTAIKTEDIIDTLSALNVLKYWKGQYIISVPSKMLEQHLKKRGNKDQITIDPSKIHWTPPNKTMQLTK